MKTGFFGISAPRIDVLWELTFGGYRGLVWISPVIVPAVAGCVMLIWRGMHRWIGILCLGIAAYYFCVNAGYYYWDGGFSTGPRHVTPALSFLIFGLALAFPNFSPGARLFTLITAVYSIAMSVLCALIDARAHDIRRNVVLDQILPDLLAGRSEMMLVRLGVPFVIAIAVPLVLLGLFFWWFRPGLGSPTPIAGRRVTPIR